MSVAVVLHGLRNRKGWTQEELAEKSGVSIRTIRNLESGRINNPRRSSVDLLLAALNEKGGPTPYEVISRRAAGLDAGVPGVDAENRPSGTCAWYGPRPPINSFVGRDRELAQLADTVLGNRVTVLTGPGGVGKTRLALTLAETLQAHLAGAVFVIPLGNVPPERGFPVVGADDLLRAGDWSQGELSALLSDTPAGGGAPATQSLVVLDNAEHLPRAAATFAERLVRERPGTHVVVTSRRAVPAPSAQVHEVTPLTMDAPGAVELLLDRVRSACPALDLSHDLDAVRTLCHRLEGIPRAIEFAAERLRAIPVGRLLADTFGTYGLGSSAASAFPHQRSLSESVRWSLELLDDRHRDVLGVLAGIRSPFTIDEVEQALIHSDFSSTEMFDLLAELVENSLVHVCHGRQYTYHMLSQVRAFAC